MKPAWQTIEEKADDHEQAARRIAIKRRRGYVGGRHAEAQILWSLWHAQMYRKGAAEMREFAETKDALRRRLLGVMRGRAP